MPLDKAELLKRIDLPKIAMALMRGDWETMLAAIGVSDVGFLSLQDVNSLRAAFVEMAGMAQKPGADIITMVGNAPMLQGRRMRMIMVVEPAQQTADDQATLDGSKQNVPALQAGK